MLKKSHEEIKNKLIPYFQDLGSIKLMKNKLDKIKIVKYLH